MGLLTNGAFFFSTLLEFCWSHFRDRQISQVETGAFPDFRKTICRLVTQFKRFKETAWDRPSRKNCLKEKQNKTSKVVFARVRGLAETGPRLTTGTYAKRSFALYKEMIPAILARGTEQDI